MPRRYYSNTAVPTLLTADITDVATTIAVGATTGYPTSYPFTLVLDKLISGKAEIVDVTGATGLSLTVVRGVDGTTAVAHTSGAIVTHDHTARDYHDTQDALDGLTAASGTYVPVDGSLNKTALTPFRAALANRDTAAVNIVSLGDSITEGTGATLATTRWLTRLQKGLRDRFPIQNVTGDPVGHVPALRSSTTIPAYWTQAGTARTNATAGSTTYGMSRQNDPMTAVGQSDTITFTGTSIDLHYAADLAGAVMSVTIDGGAPTLVSTVGATGGGQVWSSGPLGAGSHTVVVAYDASSAASSILFFEGAYLYNGDETKGIHVWNAGHHGFTSASFAGGSTGWYRSFRLTKADLLIIELGANDLTNAISATTFQANVTTLLTNVRTQLSAANIFATSVVLMMVYERTTGGSTGFTAQEPWANYVAAAKAIAVADPLVCVLDLGARMPSPVGNNPSPTGDLSNFGLYADTVHPSDKGHAFIADQLLTFLVGGIPAQADPSVLHTGQAVRTPSKTGYIAPGFSPSTSATLGSGNLRLQPIDLPAGKITSIGVDVSAAGTAGCTLRLGIYADDGSMGYPGALLLDAGTVAGDAISTPEITVSLPITGGRYWIGAALQGAPATQPTVRTSTAPSVVLPLPTAATVAVNAILGYAQTSVTGALPGTFTTGVINSSVVPRVFVKVVH